MRGEHDDFLGFEPSERDGLSSDDGGARQSVDGPYRDRRDALVSRRRRLAEELDDARRSAAREERIERHLAVIDDELRATSAAWLDAITIASPCRERWDAMRGTDAVRRCDRCRREVHDLAKMTRDEIETLFARADGSSCVRLRRRSDGTVVTGDCPTPVAGPLRRAAGVVAAGVVFGVSAGTAASLTMAPLRERAEPAVVVTRPVHAPRVVVAPPPDVPHVDLRALRSTPEEDPAIVMGAAIAPTPAPLTDADYDRHIRWIAPQAWEIDRELVDRVLASAALELRGTPRVIPAERDGRVIGVRVHGVRAGSLLARLGIENGDTILDVNGRPIAQPDAALEAYTTLRRADALFVRIERRGAERMHVVRIAG